MSSCFSDSDSNSNFTTKGKPALHVVKGNIENHNVVERKVINPFIKQQQNYISVGDSTVETEDLEAVMPQNYV